MAMFDFEADFLNKESKSEKDKERFWRKKFSLPFFAVSAAEKIIMTRNLEVMFSTGLSLVKSADILAVQTKNKKLKAVLLDIKEKINKGEPLSLAMARHPSVFSELFVSMVKVGEESGSLDESLKILALQISREHEMKSKIKNAMIYPSFILATMLAVGAVVVVFVLPNLNIFFASLGADIPIYTKALLWAGGFMSENWSWVFLSFFISAALFIAAVRTEKGGWAKDALFLRLPLIASAVKKSNAAFFIRSLSSLTAAGVSLARALEITAGTTSNRYFKKAIADTGERIKKGEKFSEALRSHGSLFPFGTAEMIEIGEETGKTSSILRKLADFYEQEVIRSIEKISSMVEPILIIILGLAVGFFAISVIQPMYSSLQAINQ